MHIFLKVLTYSLIPLIVSGVISALSRAKSVKSKKDGTVYLSKALLIIGVIGATASIIPAIITLYSNEKIIVPIGFLAFALLSSTLIVAYINCRIYYDENGFTARNFFGIKRKFTYDEITGIKEDMHEDYLYMGNRKVMIDSFSVGACEFLAFVHRKYRSINKKNLPKILKTKRDIFNGNIQDSGGFIFVYALLELFLIGFLIFILYYTYGNASMKNVGKSTVIFSECVLDDDTLKLTSSDGEKYELSFLSDDFNTDKIKAICDGSTYCDVYAKKITPDNGSEYYSIKAIFASDTEILSFEETREMYIKENRVILLFPIGALILWTAFIVLSIIVGRNPQKFSKRFAKFFFQEGYINYNYDR